MQRCDIQKLMAEINMSIARKSSIVNKRLKPLIQMDKVEHRIGLTNVMFNSAKMLQIRNSAMRRGSRRASPLRGLFMRPARFFVEHRIRSVVSAFIKQTRQPLRAKKVINRSIILE